MLIIKYKNKRLYINLLFGSIWVILGIFTSWEAGKFRWSNYFYIIFGVIYLGIYFWEFKNQYLTITDNFIKNNSLFGKKILLKDIIHVKKVFGDYIIKTDQKELSINMSLVHADSKAELDAFINSINLPKEETITSN
ncbi:MULTISPECIES: hypothetical protein [Bizionia]|uniref:Uncharacterized protein n=1 Tax=Bizionia algoritergicola TaxID=291187 RepID=A0A5D0R371_9FLAO|nr:MULTISPECIES: hypothetical protein [Bizionia]OBX24355.1 hypothetical protein BAA08_00745 [Bizionia sp. APA-3]TYB75276.1 hypothetical protein ES675_03885 [Bizionia algoritergicola]